ncbi:MAG TPA: hypothetical protein V6D23_01645, partial [Candidatus Obscuribacterales bacterium]
MIIVTTTLKPNDLLFFPDRIIQLVKVWNTRDIERHLLERSLETPDWTTDQLWEAGAYHHANMAFPQAMGYYHRLLQWTEHEPAIRGEVLQAIGHVFLLSGQFQDARDAFLRSLKLVQDPKVNFFLSECQFQLMQGKAALASLRAFLRDYDRKDALRAMAFTKLAQQLDHLGKADEARKTLLQAAEELESWGFSEQACSYQPLLPTAEPLPALTALPEGQNYFFEEFKEIYAYRALWQQEKVKDHLTERAWAVKQKLRPLLPLEPLANNVVSGSGRRIVVAGGFHRPEAEPYLDALISLSRKNSVTLISNSTMPPRLREEEWMRLINAGEQVVSLFKAIESNAPDLLLYMDVGPRSPELYQLACLRLAPVQATFGVYPVTSGLESLDYFLSFDWLEPATAQADYSECLHLLQGMPAQSSGLPDCYIEREQFNLQPDRHSYICPLTCLSIHREFMSQLAEILKRDPQGQILIPTYSREIDARFRAVFSQAYPQQ